MNYQEMCTKALKSMSNEEYNYYYGLYMQAQRGQISWEELWNNHLKMRDSKKHIRDIIR